MSDEEVKRKQQRPPAYSLNEIRQTVLELYKLEVKSFVQLDSYDDRNYHLQTSSSTNGSFVLKVHNGVDSENPSFIEAQMSCLACLQANGIPCPQDIGGFQKRNAYVVRLLKYIDGDLFSAKAHYLNMDLYCNLGALLGRMDLCLITKFDHPSAHRKHVWDVKNFADILQFTHCINDSLKKHLVLDTLAEFQSAAKLFENLRHSVIQGDANDRNIIVKSDSSLAIIDFGDMCYTWTISELAIAMAYGSVLVDPDLFVLLEWLNPCVALYKGYNAILPLNDDEKQVLFVLTKTRLAISLTLGAYSASKDPANMEYLMIHAVPAFKSLKALANLGQKRFLEVVVGDNGTI